MAARSNKYASINFNHLFQNNSRSSATTTATATSSAPPPPPSSIPNSYKSHIAANRTHGGMLVLTRPAPKPQPQLPPPQKHPPAAPLVQTPTKSDPLAPQLLGWAEAGSPAPPSHPSKPDRFVPPHLRPGFLGREEKPGPEFQIRSNQQGHLGSPNRKGEERRPKSGGYERMRQGGERDQGEVSRPRSSGTRPSLTGCVRYMDTGNGEMSDELLEAQAHVWNHIFNFINSMSLKCAIQLGIPDLIHNHGKPLTLPELVAQLPIHTKKTQCVYRLMRILVQSGIFAVQSVQHSGQEEGYVLTHTSRLLLKDESFSVRPFLLAMLDPVLTEPWHHASAWFQNDDINPFETAHEQTFWDFASREPRLNILFNEAMASDTRLVTSVLVKEGRGVFEGLNSLVDVGGGTGTVAKAIGMAFPHLRCTVLDLPHVVVGLQGSKNLNYLAGDMFEAIPPANTVLLKCILHDWSDEDCVKILKRCREAIPSKEKGGKVIIIDMVLKKEEGNGQSTETQLFFDMLMMILVTGRERKEKEWEKLFLDAGFSEYKITPMLGLRSLIEVYP